MARMDRGDLTTLLEAAQRGEPEAASRILPLVYQELRRLAHRQMAREPAGHTLQPTALVHEAYLRLVGSTDLRWNGRAHFYGAAAQAMRRILIERARWYKRLRHGAGHARQAVDLDSLSESDDSLGPSDLLALDEALDELEKKDARKFQVVSLRFYAGLTMEEIAQALDVSLDTVKNDWRFARVWLYRKIQPSSGDVSSSTS